ncbi:hypothetical protein ACF0H5_004971 [Mactra antiquata]
MSVCSNTVFWNVLLFITIIPSVTLGLEDGWLVNISNNIYGLSWKQAQKYLDKNSIDFKELEKHFCGQMDDTFHKEHGALNMVKERYIKCFIQEFRQSNRHVEAPVSFTYSLAFNGSELVPKKVIDALIIQNRDTFVIDTVVWMLIGDLLINRYNISFDRANMSDYRDEITPPSVQAFHFDVSIAKFLRPIESPKDQLQIEKQLCATLRNFFLEYKGCKIKSISQNNATGTGNMSFIVILKRNVDVTFNDSLLMTAGLQELFPRGVVNNRNVLIIGPLFIYADSLSVKIDELNSNVPVDTTIVEVCANETAQFLPDPNNSTMFIFCSQNNAFKFICSVNMIFDPSEELCTNVV